MKKSIAIDVVEELSQSVFDDVYFHGNKPVIIKGALKSTTLFNRWSPAYLKGKIGSRKVSMDFSSTGVYNYNRDDIKSMTLPFDQMVDLLVSDISNKGLCYLTQSSIPRYFPELLPDLKTPKWIKKTSDILHNINLWFGCKGCVTPLHIDEGQNFLLQVMGNKQLTLFSPDDSKYLYLDAEGKNKNISQVNIDDIDYEKYPLLKKAQPYHGVINKGDILYLPPLWWHQVRSLDAAISVNYWWHRFELVASNYIRQEPLERLKREIQSFLEEGINIDNPDYQGESMLVKAVRYGYNNLVHALLLLGAKPDSTSKIDKKDTPAISLAVENGNIEILKLLLAYDADVNALDAHHETPLDIARKNENRTFVELLRSYQLH